MNADHDPVVRGGGSIAALTVGLAAEVVVMVARSSRDSWPDAAGVAAQAVEIGERCPGLAREDARVWYSALQTIRSVVEDGAGSREGELRELLEGAAEVPVAIAEAAADVAALAALAATHGDGAFTVDAASAAVLAHSCASVAKHLVAVNLGTKDDDEPSRRAASAEWRAEQAASEALAATS